MGLPLIAVLPDWLHLVVVILEVAFGLGMVIFVHELGHFLVAKWCGVKCEKFYLGFDIYGLKLAKFQRGETEYGIGILPLGGYVKMLGQDDNPANAAKERERSRRHQLDGDLPIPTAEDVQEQRELDPRSYMAKSVPQRMAIISAGVVMNVIFAFIMAAVAYSLGVREMACGVSATIPGEAAWRANLQPGDIVVGINDIVDRQLRFRDLMSAVMLHNDNGVDFDIQREGVPEPFWVNVRPDKPKGRLRPTIGVLQPFTTSLSNQKPVVKGTPAAETKAFEPGDKIVAVDGTSVATYRDLLTQLVRNSEKPLRFTVARADRSLPSQEKPLEQIDIEVPARPMRMLGLVMKMGPITAVQDDSPAKAADLRQDDHITAIDGQAPGDPIRLADVLRKRAGQTMTLSITRPRRDGHDEQIEKQILLRDPLWPEESTVPGCGLSVPALGLTYQVLNVIERVADNSPAAKAQLSKDDKPSGSVLAAGDTIVQVEFQLPKKKPGDSGQTDEAAVEIDDIPPLKFGQEETNWPYFMQLVQEAPAGTKLKFTLEDGRSTTMESAPADDWFNPERGLVSAPELTMTQAHSLSEALRLAWQETRDSLGLVYSFISKIGSQVSPLNLGGPKEIAKQAGYAAYEGVAQLLIFLTMLSANLAVINFLPIPLLDGGHMVFLILEGVMRRPVSEKIVVAFHYLGFIFIISLMAFVLGLDFGIIPRH